MTWEGFGAGRAIGRGVGLGLWCPGGARSHRHAITAATAVFAQLIAFGAHSTTTTTTAAATNIISSSSYC